MDGYELLCTIEDNDLNTFNEYIGRFQESRFNDALWRCAEYDRADMMRIILNEVGRFRLKSHDFHGQTLLHRACERYSRAVIELLLSFPEVDVNTRDDLGNTPLGVLCEYERTNDNIFIALMMRHGADFSSKALHRPKPKIYFRIKLCIALVSARTIPRLGVASPFRNVPEELIKRICNATF